MHRRALVAAAALLLLARPGLADDPKQILLKSLDPRDVTFVADQVTTVTFAGAPGGRTQNQKVYRKGHLLRIEFLPGPIIFDDGTVQMRYRPAAGVVERGPSNQHPGRGKALKAAFINRRADVEQLSDDTVAGRPAYVLLVKGPLGRLERKVWIDKQTYVQLRQEMERPDRTVVTSFTKIDFGAEPPAEKLKLVPPPGTREELPRPAALRQAAAWGGLLEPGQLPPGFRLRAFFQNLPPAPPGVVAVYDGPPRRGSLSIIQGPAQGMPGMADSAGRPGRRLRVLHAQKGKADVTLVGPLSDDELQKVLDSMQ